jgi:hypothetical protein
MHELRLDLFVCHFVLLCLQCSACLQSFYALSVAYKLSKWENYEIVSRLKTKENEIRTATFLTCIDAEALEMYDGLKFDNDADKTKLEVVLQKFETFCIGETNETYERYKFNKRDQEQSETINTNKLCHMLATVLCLVCVSFHLHSFE